MSWAAGGSRAALIAAALAAGAALSGCDPHINEGVVAVNDTAQTLHFAALMSDGPRALPGTADPYGGLVILSPNNVGSDGCSQYAVAAYDPSGREVARHAPGKGLCVGDQWTIGGAAPTASG
jgi:hypothetical protein